MKNKIIELSKNTCLFEVRRKGSKFVAFVDYEDLDKIKNFKWYVNHNGYAVAHKTLKEKDYTKIFLHRTILGTDNVIDHINGNPLDNRKTNLRHADYIQNQGNRKLNKNNKVGYKGVFQSRNGNYVAQIKINYKSTHLGTFQTPEEAALAYNDAAIKHFGEFAKLNKVDST